LVRQQSTKQEKDKDWLLTNTDVQFYIVATPIGNKSDLTQRAIEILKSVDIIACEDSRTSAKLLENYDIQTKLVSYHKFNEKQRTPEFIKLLECGKKIALISDAGTPCISDPGRILVKELHEHNIKITSIPGASALTAFASMVPRNSEEFAFIGFLPRERNQQRNFINKYINTDLIFYESPLRLLETLENIKEFRGNNAQIAIGRELTKMFEEVKVDNIEKIINYYQNNILKGEIVCMLYAQTDFEEKDSIIIDNIKKLKDLKYSDKDIAQIISTLFDLNKNKVYKLALNIQNIQN